MILICLPYYKSKDTLQQAVDSLLTQTYNNFEILIVNDGDPQSPREFIKPHPKIKFFDMKKNRGRYFVDAVAVKANPHTFYLPADSDDISLRDRLKILTTLQSKTKADAVFHRHRVIGRNGRKYLEKYFYMNNPQSGEMKHLAHHSALYRTEALRSIGSYHPDFRVGFDTLLVNLVKMKLRYATAGRVLQVRRIRDNSLTTSKMTGFGSRHRKVATMKLRMLYDQCFSNPDDVKDIIEKSIKKETMKQVNEEAERLKKEMKW